VPGFGLWTHLGVFVFDNCDCFRANLLIDVFFSLGLKSQSSLRFAYFVASDAAGMVVSDRVTR
jgi:hypothetical protein